MNSDWDVRVSASDDCGDDSDPDWLLEGAINQFAYILAERSTIDGILEEDEDAALKAPADTVLVMLKKVCNDLIASEELDQYLTGHFGPNTRAATLPFLKRQPLLVTETGETVIRLIFDEEKNKHHEYYQKFKAHRKQLKRPLAFYVKDHARLEYGRWLKSVARNT